MSITHRRTFLPLSRRAKPALAAVAMLIAAAGNATALTLDDAVAAALSASPELAALEQQVRALEAASEQARLLPNPELQTEVENVAGSGSREGDEAAESTLRLSQRLELGGKRAARSHAAASAVEAAAAELELRRRDLTASVKTAFAAALAAQQRVVLARDLEQLANDALRSVSTAVGAGATSAVEHDRAHLTVAKATGERLLRERQAVAARSALAATWGDAGATFGDLAGTLDTRIVLPPRDDFLAAAGGTSHPAIARAEASIAKRAAAVSLERANRIPDVTVAAGGRHFNDDDDVAAVFSLSAPLPLFDRNQGQIAEAEARLAEAREERRSADVTLRTSLSAAYDHYVAADEQRALLEEQVLPAATRALETTTAAYRNGSFPYHEVVAARRTLYELRTERVDRLEERFTAAVELERLSDLALIPLADGVHR
jgi:cobalt-zinc-cadmium efflux system outer membrane protein